MEGGALRPETEGEALMELIGREAGRASILRSRLIRTLASDSGAINTAKVPEASAAAGVPIRLQSLSMKDIGPQPVQQQLQDLFALVPNRGQWPDGVVVVGSNFLAPAQFSAVLLNGALVRGLVSKWTNFAEFTDWAGSRVEVSKNTAQFDDGLLDDWYQERADIAHVYELWVLHDLRLSLLTPYLATELFKLLSIRHAAGLITVVTTMESTEDLSQSAPDVFDILSIYEIVDLGSKEGVLCSDSTRG